jgi:hypothetical protein
MVHRRPLDLAKHDEIFGLRFFRYVVKRLSILVAAADLSQTDGRSTT